jgi:RNA polymerase sigma factor (sigma-70 family)
MPVYGPLRLSARAGDERSFETIFKRHHAPLLSYCRHMLGDQDEAEDALQQAFIKAHQALLGGTAPRELRPWLYAIARNCCLSAIAARKPTTALTDHTPSLAGLSEQVREREDLRELVADVGRLPEDQRSALLLSELDDLSHQAIAAIVGCPVSKVKALVYQARTTLIAERNARNTSCHEIRERLSVARGGELRRGPLRRHLALCAGCSEFQQAVSAQRRSLAAALPVLPSAGLAARILGHGAAHAGGVAGVGHAGGGGLLAPTGTAGAGATATGSAGITATGSAGIGVSGTGIATTGTTAATSAAGAIAGTGGASTGAFVGGGVLAKLAVGGAVAALATAGAVAIHHHPGHASQRAALPGRRDAASPGDASPSSAQAGAPALNAVFVQPDEPVRETGASGSGASETALAGMGGSAIAALPGPGVTSTVTRLAQAGPANPAQPGSAGSTPGSAPGSSGKSSHTGRHRSAAATRRAHLRKLQRKRLLKQRRLLKRRQLLRRRQLLKRRRPLKRVATPVNPPAATPSTPVKPAHKHKPRTVTAATQVTAGQSTGNPAGGSESKTATGPRHRPAASTGAGAGTGKAGASTGAGKTGSGKAEGSGSGKAGGASGSTPSKRRKPAAEKQAAQASSRKAPAGRVPAPSQVARRPGRAQRPAQAQRTVGAHRVIRRNGSSKKNNCPTFEVDGSHTGALQLNSLNGRTQNAYT